MFDSVAKKGHSLALRLILLIAIAVVYGCSDGTDRRITAVQDSPAAGIYVPSTFAVLGEPALIGNTRAIVSPTGEARLIMLDGPWFDDVIPISPPYQVVGMLDLKGRDVQASMRVFPDGQVDSSPLLAEGEFVRHEYIYADYSWGDQQGQFQLTYSELNNGRPGLDQLEGIWSVTIGFASGGNGVSFENLVVSLTIYSDGSAFGSDTSGCTYSGTFSIIRPIYNFYHLELELSSCGARDGQYDGLAFIGPAPLPELPWRTLHFGVTGQGRSFNASLAGPPYP